MESVPNPLLAGLDPLPLFGMADGIQFIPPNGVACHTGYVPWVMPGGTGVGGLRQFDVLERSCIGWPVSKALPDSRSNPSRDEESGFDLRALGLELGGEDFRQGTHPAFGYRICAQSGDRIQCGHGRGVDYVAASGVGLEEWKKDVHPMDDPVQVDVDHPFPVCHGQIRYVAERSYSGIVEHKVYFAVGPQHCGGKISHACFTAHINLDERYTEFGACFSQGQGLDVCEDDARPLADKFFRDTAPNSRRCACYDGDLSLNRRHDVSLNVCGSGPTGKSDSLLLGAFFNEPGNLRVICIRGQTMPSLIPEVDHFLSQTGRHAQFRREAGGNPCVLQHEAGLKS